MYIDCRLSYNFVIVYNAFAYQGDISIRVESSTCSVGSPYSVINNPTHI